MNLIYALEQLREHQMDCVKVSGDLVYIVDKMALLSFQVDRNSDVVSYEVDTGGGHIFYSPDDRGVEDLSFLHGIFAGLRRNVGKFIDAPINCVLDRDIEVELVVESLLDSLGAHAKKISLHYLDSSKLRIEPNKGQAIEVLLFDRSKTKYRDLKVDFDGGPTGDENHLGGYLAGYASEVFGFWDEWPATI